MGIVSDTSSYDDFKAVVHGFSVKGLAFYAPGTAESREQFYIEFISEKFDFLVIFSAQEPAPATLAVDFPGVITLTSTISPMNAAGF